MSNSAVKTPDQLLDELGITDPSDLKIEAIAYYCQAVIVYEALTGCEANIVGSGDRAIITVNNQSTPARQRFSAGHELGHWMRDRGQAAFGCSKQQLNSQWFANNPETRANQFASDLLLPNKLFLPLAKGQPFTVNTVRHLGTRFQMSLTATAIKLVRNASFPSMLIYCEDAVRKWFIPSEGLPKQLWPVEHVSEGSLTARVLAGSVVSDLVDDTRSDKWFDVPGGNKHYVRESCFRNGPDSSVTLVWWEDEKQVIELENEDERNAARRSDWRDE